MCEYWLTNEEINTLAILDLTVTSHFCRNNKSGGGTAILHNKSGRGTAILHNKRFVSENIFLNVEPIEQIFEYCASSLKSKNLKFIIISIYRLPNADTVKFFENLELLLSHAFKQCTKIILTGDFNINLFAENNNKSHFLDIFSRL